MNELEKDIERFLCAQIRLEGGLCLKWVCPGWAGVPDRICLLPGGNVAFVELKRPTGELASRQKWWRDKLRALGFECRTVWSREDVGSLMEWLRVSCIEMEDVNE